MGMGSVPAHATCISKENLIELCPEQMGQLETRLNELGISLGQLAELLDETSASYKDHKSVGLEKQQSAELFNAWQAVADEFTEVTNTNGRGLEVYICFYDPDRGDRHDEIDGNYYFSVEGVHQLTPAGQRFHEKLEDKMWTVFG
jgi:hypothetical protein